MNDKITVKQAAAQIGKSEQFVRVGLQRGLLPFGYALKTSSQWSYHINKTSLDKYIAEGMTAQPNIKLTVEHAAWLMGKSTKFVESGLQQNVLPFGVAVQIDSYTWDYYISPKLFSEYTGIEFNEG